MTAPAVPINLLPPPQPALGRSVVMAVAAHVALVAALAWGVTWQHQAPLVVAEAELWARVPQAAAPRELVPAPVLPPAVQPAPQPAAPAAAPPQRPPDISTQREAAARRTQDQADQARRERESRQREREQAEATRREQARQEQLRQDQLRRVAGLAGASGSAGASGASPQAAGPSATYAGRVVARVRPNIVFTDTVSGDPVAEVEVRAASDGTILSRRIVRASGVPGWDDAVLRALDRTAVLPRDTDGRVPSPMVIAFRPQG